MIQKNSGWVALAGGLCLFRLSLWLGYRATTHLIATQANSVEQQLRSGAKDISGISQKLDLLINSLAGSRWSAFAPLFALQTTVFVLITLVFGTAWGVLGDNAPTSYVLLSKKAIAEKAKAERRLRRRWLEFGLTFILGAIASIIAAKVLTYME